jgi:hypothetical protein
MEENNKIIAEFMGAKLTKDLQIVYPIYEGDSSYVKNLKYHSDWNWLMEVVEKIYQTNLYYDKYIDYNSSMFTNGKIELSTNKESVYNQCIDFINFYNKRKEK